MLLVMHGGGCEGELTKDELPVHLHEFEPPYIFIWIHHLLLNVAFVEVVLGGIEWGWRGTVVSGDVSWIAQERDWRCHD
jgi:hypothetical protein